MSKKKIILSHIIIEYLNQLGFCNEINAKISNYLKELGLGEVINYRIMRYLNELGFSQETNNTIINYLNKIEVNEETITKLVNHMNEASVNYKVLSYFLFKNINAIFGKDEFDEETIDTELIIDNSKKELGNKTRKLKVSYAGLEYIISSSSKGQMLEMNVKNSPIGFNINIDNNAKRINNAVVGMNDAQTVFEYQNICLKEIPTFDYQKVIYNNDGEEILTPAYRIRPIEAKRGKSEIFSLECLEPDKISLFHELEKLNLTNLSFSQKVYCILKEIKNNFKKNERIVSIPMSYELIDIYDYLNEIYRVLEEKCEIKCLCLERKNKNEYE